METGLVSAVTVGVDMAARVPSLPMVYCETVPLPLVT